MQETVVVLLGFFSRCQNLSAASFALFAIGVGETLKLAFVQGTRQERQHKATQGDVGKSRVSKSKAYVA